MLENTTDNYLLCQTKNVFFFFIFQFQAFKSLRMRHTGTLQLLCFYFAVYKKKTSQKTITTHLWGTELKITAWLFQCWCWPGWHFEFICPFEQFMEHSWMWRDLGYPAWGLELWRAIRQRPADSLTAGTQWGSIITPLTWSGHKKVRCKDKTGCQEHRVPGICPLTGVDVELLHHVISL